MKDVLDKAFDDIMEDIKNPKIKCYTTIILDRSGSMTGHEQESVDEFNNQLAIAKEQKDLDMYMSLVTFSFGVDKAQHWLEPVDSIKPMSLMDYKPNGGTALLDAIGFTLTKLRYETDVHSRHLVFVISDGGENQSYEYKAESIKKLLDEFNEDKRWTITYFGCNVDTMTLTRDYGFNASNLQAFAGVSGEQGMYGSAGTTIRGNNSRLYYNTVGSGVNVTNFYNTTSMVVSGGVSNGQA